MKPVMKLIVGLGNPGKKYEGTRHNAGFMAIDELKKYDIEDSILAKPKTFMNNSGKAVKEMVGYYKVKPEDLWVIHDDIDLPIGEFKISENRGSAGHKGVQSIIDELGIKNFNRIRIGICPAEGKPERIEEFVLKKFSKKESEGLKEALSKITEKMKSRG
jgi:peptidyl-tRNA hydrolase, PTH1 family